MVEKSPILGYVAAVSVGVVNDEILLDLCYTEDSVADVDMNIVMRDAEFVEVQGTGEGATFKRETLNEMLDLASKGIANLMQMQRKILQK